MTSLRKVSESPLAGLRLLEFAGIGAQNDIAQWPLLHDTLEAIFKTRTLAEWNERLEGSDSCYAPVLSLSEAMFHPHNAARKTFVEVEGVRQPAPAPRFSRTPSAIQGPPAIAATPCAVVIDR